MPRCSECKEAVRLSDAVPVMRGLRSEKPPIWLCERCFRRVGLDRYKGKCAGCGDPVVMAVREGARKFCSLECEARYWNVQRPLGAHKPRTCLCGCGRSWTPKRRDEEYFPKTRNACKQRVYRQRL